MATSCGWSLLCVSEGSGTTKSEMDFMQAVKTGHVDRVCSFIQQGTDVNSQDQYGNTALHYAAHAGKLDMVRLLLTNEANIISKNKSGLTPLHFAAFGGSQQVLRELLQRRPDCIDLQSDKGFSLLHEAVRGKHVKTVEVLLEEKADSNLKDKNGNTPLHMAVSQKSLQICRCILKHTPDLQLRNQDENTCLHLAASVGSLQICQLLLDQDSSLATARDKNGESFLFHAVRGSAQSTDKGYVELVRQILENSGCVLYRNEAGLKVLDVARLTATPVPILHLISEKTEEQQSSDLAKSCQQLKNRPVKLFICGHCGVGKTTLVNALHRKEMGWLSKYQFLCGSPEAPPSTKGVNITYSNLAGEPSSQWIGFLRKPSLLG
ncbi:ankyrin-3-like [Rhinatrema bivittatum]|uniref:ankyrin-3-like n=1 Tax=Rhinatrema bivittatum TaxID=194408 RepID=UPI00112D5C6B|nr:ankyrin-3-like [Rhinatrema bivittatum]